MGVVEDIGNVVVRRHGMVIVSGMSEGSLVTRCCSFRRVTLNGHPAGTPT